MRNLFDQYEQPENRLTHALMTALNEDRDLLGKFVEWATGKRAPARVKDLLLLEQSFPDEQEPPEEENESGPGGLPDGCIYDGGGWALLIESKIKARLNPDQLKRHRQSAEKHNLTNVDLIALVVSRPKHPHTENATVRRWSELYEWIKKQQAKSKWPGRLMTYMEVMDAKLPNDGYLKEGALTVFTGIPFRDQPYNYDEAKRLIRLLMDELRVRKDLERELRIDMGHRGRSSITGRDTTSVWDFLWLADAKSAKDFKEFPHLTVGIHQEYLQVVVIVPHGIRSEFRTNLVGGGIEEFRSLFRTILDRFSKSIGTIEGAFPSVEMVQRRYPTQRQEPFLDAKLEFDLRTGFESTYSRDKSPKWQPQWLEAAYNALTHRRSNLQLAVGAKFDYKRCAVVSNRELLNHIAAVWIACKPLIRKMVP